MGLTVRGIDPTKPDAEALGKLLKEAQEHGIYTPVSYFLLRAMAKARYSETHSAHFGLGIENYCHFTSPIRRLSDLATHRIIHRVLIYGKSPNAYTSYARRAAAAATDSEIRAMTAERKIEDLYKTIYMREKVGEVFEASVSSVASFGIFAQLDNTCEGLIPMSELPGYFVYDERTMSVRSGSLVYRVGDRVKVRLEEADMARCKLRFSLLLD
jgi:ribonuclease R